MTVVFIECTKSMGPYAFTESISKSLCFQFVYELCALLMGEGNIFVLQNDVTFCYNMLL